MKVNFDSERRDYDRKLEASRTDVTDIERKLRLEADTAASDYKMKVSLYFRPAWFSSRLFFDKLFLHSNR